MENTVQHLPGLAADDKEWTDAQIQGFLALVRALALGSDMHPFCILRVVSYYMDSIGKVPVQSLEAFRDIQQRDGWIPALDTLIEHAVASIRAQEQRDLNVSVRFAVPGGERFNRK